MNAVSIVISFISLPGEQKLRIEYSEVPIVAGLLLQAPTSTEAGALPLCPEPQASGEDLTLPHRTLRFAVLVSLPPCLDSEESPTRILCVLFCLDPQGLPVSPGSQTPPCLCGEMPVCNSCPPQFLFCSRKQV